MVINEKRWVLLIWLLDRCSSGITWLRFWDERISLHLGLLLRLYFYSRVSKRLCIKMNVLRLFSLIAIITRLEWTVCKWWGEQFMAWLTPTTIVLDYLIIVFKHLMMLWRNIVGRIMLWTGVALFTDRIMLAIDVIIKILWRWLLSDWNKCFVPLTGSFHAWTLLNIQLLGCRKHQRHLIVIVILVIFFSRFSCIWWLAAIQNGATLSIC